MDGRIGGGGRDSTGDTPVLVRRNLEWAGHGSQGYQGLNGVLGCHGGGGLGGSLGRCHGDPGSLVLLVLLLEQGEQLDDGGHSHGGFGGDGCQLLGRGGGGGCRR